MKKALLALLLAPIFYLSAGQTRPFENFDPFFDFSEIYYYGNVQSSLNQPLAGIGMRYQDDEIGFDANFSGMYQNKKNQTNLQLEASILYFPFTDYAYLGFGGGLNLSFSQTISRMTFLRATLGTEFRFNRSGKYFLEGILETPTNFNMQKIDLKPGFRFGVGF